MLNLDLSKLANEFYAGRGFADIAGASTMTMMQVCLGLLRSYGITSPL